ncbi:MAG: NUDIX domain-containing protein [Patescibacteria group bacterium]|nr:NUDIX domain-containing protein [Patescibacteria group bacterium]
MKKIRSAGAVVFRQEKGEILFLLICYGTKEKFWWDFPRGQIETGEDEKETVRREIFEETGIKNLEFIPGFREKYQYYFRGYRPEEKKQLVFKENTIYLTRTKTKKIKLSFEHHDFAWLSYENALEKLTFKNSKEILQKAYRYLRQQRKLDKKEKNVKIKKDYD